MSSAGPRRREGPVQDQAYDAATSAGRRSGRGWEPDELGEEDDAEEARRDEARRGERHGDEDRTEDRADERAELGAHRLGRDDLRRVEPPPASTWPPHATIAASVAGRRARGGQPDEHDARDDPGSGRRQTQRREARDPDRAAEDDRAPDSEAVGQRAPDDEHPLLGERAQSKDRLDDPPRELQRVREVGGEEGTTR